MTLSAILAGIAWDPQIRGFLAVGTGVLVLMGSVYLVLGTNLGNRLGFLVALTGFFGWMVIMGTIWWIYGIGMKGADPSWEVEEINTGDLTQTALEDAQDIDTSNLPDPDVLRDLTEDEFATVAEEEQADLAGWTLLSEANPARGEAQAVVDEVLTDGRYVGIDATTDYLAQYAFEIGGKPQREGDSVIDRVSNKISNTLRITSPPHYAIVQVCVTTEESRPESAAAGEAPPELECDPNADMISVVMIRNLGDRRFPAAMITLGSGLIFALLCVMLHLRDRRVEEHLSAPLPAPTPAPTGG